MTLLRSVPSVLTAVICVALLSAPGTGWSANGDCSQPSSTGSSPTATDCLFILSAAVGVATCDPECICAPKGSLPPTATDALICLNNAVGVPIDLNCPCQSTTTTTLGSPNDYRAEVVSYMNSMTIPFVDLNADEIVAECCRDFGSISRDFIENGTNNIDNSMAGLSAVMAAFTNSDLNDQIVSAFSAGEVVNLLDHRGISAALTARGPNSFSLAWLQGTFANGTNFSSANAGDGRFLLDPTTFVADTGQPRAVLAGETFSASAMSATGGGFTVAIPFGGVVMELAVELAEISGMHSGVTPDGLAYTGGTVTGVIPVDDMIRGINQYLQASVCNCLGVTSDVFTRDTEGAWVGTGCVVKATSCTNAEEQLCVILGERFDLDDEDAIGVCDVVPDVLANVADIDLDGDPATFEGLSSGERFTAVTGEIIGVEE